MEWWCAFANPCRTLTKSCSNKTTSDTSRASKTSLLPTLQKTCFYNSHLFSNCKTLAKQKKEVSSTEEFRNRKMSMILIFTRIQRRLWLTNNLRCKSRILWGRKKMGVSMMSLLILTLKTVLWLLIKRLNSRSCSWWQMRVVSIRRLLWLIKRLLFWILKPKLLRKAWSRMNSKWIHLHKSKLIRLNSKRFQFKRSSQVKTWFKWTLKTLSNLKLTTK